MGSQNSISGVVPILPTPFDSSQNIFFPDYKRLLDFCALSGVGACGLPAYGSEYYKLETDERLKVVEAAVAASKGRVPVVAQCNHMATTLASDLACRCFDSGADAIALELPRRFPYPDSQLLEFAVNVAESVTIPVLIQDWNPGGTTVDAAFVKELNIRCPNVTAIKLEEPNLGEKVQAIISETQGRVKVFEGWGGLYTLELLPSGISGIMPGTALADVMVKVFEKGLSDPPGSYELLASFMPYLVFSLQNMEHFHHVEKALLKRRGILTQDYIRDLTVALDDTSRRYLDLVLDGTCVALERHGFIVKPLD